MSNAFIPTGTMSGSMGTVKNLIGKVNPSSEIDGSIYTPTDIKTPIYNGEYIVTPKAFKEQTLKTNGKKMINDVTIKEVPYYETSNTDGGETVYIAGEVNYG